MRLDDLPARKQREIIVGRKFIEEYNRAMGRCFALDESYWDSDPDPAPDLRFSQASEELFAEVVCFDEGGQEGFIRASATSRLVAAIQEALDSRGATGFLMMVQPADPRRVPHGQKLWAYAHSLVSYVLDKVNLLRQQRYKWAEQHERAWKFVLSNLHSLDIQLNSAERASCAVSAGVRMINTVEALEEAVHGKDLKRYGPRTQLLIDNQGHLVTSVELFELLEGRTVSMDGFDGVWFVSLQEGKVSRLDAPCA